MESMLLRRYAVLHPDHTRLAIITFAGDTQKPIDYISQVTSNIILDRHVRHVIFCEKVNNKNHVYIFIAQF